MPDIHVSIGGRQYEVACQEGEEAFLRTAAAMLDAEAAVLGPQAARIPETRLLLMAGLMLADKTAGMDDTLRATEARLAEAEAELVALRREVAQARSGSAGLSATDLERLLALAERSEKVARVIETKFG